MESNYNSFRNLIAFRMSTCFVWDFELNLRIVRAPGANIRDAGVGSDRRTRTFRNRADRYSEGIPRVFRRYSEGIPKVFALFGARNCADRYSEICGDDSAFPEMRTSLLICSPPARAD